MKRREHKQLLRGLKVLKFEEAEMNAMPCYLSEPYKVTHNDWTEINGRLVKEGSWSAYYRIYDAHTRAMLFGDSVESGKTYATKEEAFKACQNHLDNRDNPRTQAGIEQDYLDNNQDQVRLYPKCGQQV